MELSEKQIIELAEKIFESYVNLSLGKEPGLLSGSVYKSIDSHPRTQEMLNVCKEYFNAFDGSIREIPEWEKLSKFRLRLVELYMQK
ncbi:MAG: hypothetical protein HY958_06165 [Bacteroidia bacterium]|nr:hypothetical protein [Bacteroidia bacterium]